MKLTINDWGKMIGQKARTPYGDFKLSGVLQDDLENLWFEGDDVVESIEEVTTLIHRFEECKPILRSFDQMTEEEKHSFANIVDGSMIVAKIFIKNDKVMYEYRYVDSEVDSVFLNFATITQTDYLDFIGIDQRGWIEKGLAIQEGEDEVAKI